MRKIVLFMHTSLDGFVAGPKGEMDWINVDEEIFDYAGQRTNEADTALYGRVTYLMMENYWPTAADKPTATKHDIKHSRWYNKVAKVVLSKSMQGENLKNTTIISDNIQGNINKIKQKEGNDIIIFGSPRAAHSLMKFNLIDDYWLFVNPIILGNGIPLFCNTEKITRLKLKATNAFSSGVVCLHYEGEINEKNLKESKKTV